MLLLAIRPSDGIIMDRKTTFLSAVLSISAVTGAVACENSAKSPQPAKRVESTSAFSKPEIRQIPDLILSGTQEIDQRKITYYLHAVAPKINDALDYLKMCPGDIARQSETYFRTINSESNIGFYTDEQTGAEAVTFVIIKDEKRRYGQIIINPEKLLDSSTSIEEIAKSILKATISYMTYRGNETPGKFTQRQEKSLDTVSLDNCLN